METKVDSLESKLKAVSSDEESTTDLNFNDLNMAKQKELLLALESLSLDVLGRDYQEKMHNLQRMIPSVFSVSTGCFCIHSVGHNRIRIQTVYIRQHMSLFPTVSDHKTLCDVAVQYIESLEHRTRENEAYESQIAAMKQHNDFLQQSANQWNCRFNESQIALLDLKEENITLRTEMSTLKTLYHSLMTLTPQTLSDATVDSTEDDEMSHTLKQCMEENKQFKRENIKYLNQLKEANTKYTECNAKYIELSSLQRAQQNELRSTRSRAAELEEMLQDCFSEIRFLERETADLRQAVSALIF